MTGAKETRIMAITAESQPSTTRPCERNFKCANISARDFICQDISLARDARLQTLASVQQLPKLQGMAGLYV